MASLQALQGLSGERRRAVARGLWTAFREDRRQAAILVGFSGTGKSERVALPLVAQARSEGIPAVHLDVPARPTQLDQELLGRLVEGLQEAGRPDLAEKAAVAPNFSVALREVLSAGGLVVIDEFQRLLQGPRGEPVEPYGQQLSRIARRPADGGGLWLVSNRNVDPEWSEPFYLAFLEPPEDVGDVMRIVLDSLGTEDASERIPASRHQEIAERFGRNPRALRLLGSLMRFHPLEELIGPAQAAAEGLTLQELSDRVERSLLQRAKAGLSNAAAEFLRDLSVLTEPARIELLSALGSHLGDVQALLAELQQRFLIELRQPLRQPHPLVREVELPRLIRDKDAYQAANLRAGNWHKVQLANAVGASDDLAIAAHLGAAQHHYLAAGAKEDFQDVIARLRSYIERRFNWTTANPSTDAERDAQISLVEIALEHPATPASEYYLARLLKARGSADDLARALAHATRAVVGQDFSDPWVVRLQLAYLVHGPEAAIAIGPEAIAAVDPDKNLFSVMQVYAAALSHAGRGEEAIEVLLGTAARISDHGARWLIEEAIAFAAALAATSQLEAIRDWAKVRENEYGPALALANVLLDERAGNWTRAAQRAQIARRHLPRYLHLALHEAFCWLATGEADKAQEALDRFPLRWRFETRTGLTWLAALVALRAKDVAGGRQLAEIYMDEPLSLDTATIERALIREWDTRVATLSEPNPALEFPILPPALSGLAMPIIRPQHGGPVLPQHQTGAGASSCEAEGRIRMLSVGTEWASGQGGLSSFNRQLCIALAATGADVTCIAIEPSRDDIAEAQSFGVRLVAARATPGVDQREWLARRPAELGDDYNPDFVIGHGRITGPAALRLAEDVFSGAKRLHFLHMAPDEIEWHKFDREAPAGQRAEERTKLELDLARTAHRAVAVGPRLYNRLLRDLSPSGASEPLRFDPGFDRIESPARTPPRGGPWKILLLGRAEDEKLKGLDIAARAIGRFVQRRPTDLPGIELVVRGARPESVDALRLRILEWAAAPTLQVIVRGYSTDLETLDQDMQTSSLVLMPSRSEGFGLVGQEAIVAGTPVLISSQSGLADAMKEWLDIEMAARVIVGTTGDEMDAEPDIDQWANAIEAVLRNRDASFRDASELQAILGERLTWKGSAQGLLSELVKV